MAFLQGKLALVTGAATGIGRALACELARAGADLLLADINEPELKETARLAGQAGHRIAVQVIDLASSEEIAKFCVRIEREFPQLSVLVNNAGVAYYGCTHAMTDAQCQHLLAVNLHAPLQLTRTLLPLLSRNGRSHILNMCSIAGLVGVNRLAAYNASKFALVGLSESLRAEYGPRGIGVTAVCPGLVRTRIFETAMTGGVQKVPRFPRWLTISPESVARRAVWALGKNGGLVVISPAAQVIWTIKRLVPSFFDRVQQVRRARHAREGIQAADTATGSEIERRAA